MGNFKKILVGLLGIFLLSSGEAAPKEEIQSRMDERVIIPDLLFERFGSKDDLPDNRIRSIFQDKKGILWIGTMNGICQYDGYTFRKDLNSKTPHLRSGSWTYDICEDSLQNIWLGTTNGLNVYNKVTEEFAHYAYDPGNPNSIADNEIRSILYDQSHNLWIGTGKGLVLYDKRKDQFIRFNEYPLNTRIYKIIQSYEDFIWIACSDGMVHYNVKTAKYQFYKKEIKASPYGDRVWSALEVNRSLLIGTGGEGLLRLTYDPVTKDYSGFESVNSLIGNSENLNKIEIFDICQSKTGDIWLGTSHGIAKLQGLTSRFFVTFGDAQNIPKILHIYLIIR